MKIKRIYEEPAADDGFRILVDRIWPRGISKEKASLDLWMKEISPSTELRKWYGHDPEKYPEFRARYFEELEKNPEADELREILSSHQGNVTLLFSAKDEKRSNARVLLDWLSKK